MIPLWALQFLAGGLGGLVRGILGIYKNYSSNPQTFKFDAKYLGITLFCFHDCWSIGRIRRL